MPAASFDTPINYLPFDFTCSCGAQGTILNISKQSLLTQGSPKNVPQRRKKLKTTTQRESASQQVCPSKSSIKTQQNQINKAGFKQCPAEWMRHHHTLQWLCISHSRKEKSQQSTCTISSGGESALALTVPYTVILGNSIQSSLAQDSSHGSKKNKTEHMTHFPEWEGKVTKTFKRHFTEMQGQ